MPNTIRPIGVPRRAAQHGGPEHEPLHFLTAGLHDALVTYLANQHRHLGLALERFDRHVVWLRGRDVETYVIIDDLAAASGEHRFEWLLHAAREMQTDAAARCVTIRNTKAEARVSILEPAALSFRQTDQFDPPPENWRPDRQTDYKNQWHLAVASKPAAAVRYVAVVEVGKQGFRPASVQSLDCGARVAGWDVRLDGRRVTIARSK